MTISPRPQARAALAGFALAVCGAGLLLLAVRMFGGASWL